MEKGDKVKCIAAKFVWDNFTPIEYRSIDLPKKNAEYTVRQVVKTEYGIGIGIRLVEIVNPQIHHDQGGVKEPVFSIARFEKIKKK